MNVRKDRKPDEIRQIKIEKDIIKHAEGSVLMSFGDTKVICVATVENKVPPFMRGEGKGWVTAEYSMLPRATESRNIREAARGKLSGRTNEIQRMIGRSLRSVVDLEGLGERTIWIDCDVIQADGGTRTTAISGGYIALVQALKGLVKEEKLKEIPVKNYLGAVSVGILDGEVLLDLDFSEDYNAEADMNFAMTDEKGFVEIQGTGESFPFSKDKANKMIGYAEIGIEKIIEKQKEFIEKEL
ncbi:ribonuclease PH [Natranaerofaba carboxydovora]|uniref:ribonuclease PH n=1 Tax=Natranaerofaba carboxydovora TaxID=2742683 RepID=UPI001F140D28|nr:ribonuclease PH [Natranaerofaba carboxydovora]UMZ72827.1 Ribonuclease PH [Natranaerofaba carboxydovora]